MSDVRPEDLGETPTIEVRVFRHGELVERELCESEEQAAQIVEGWAEVDGVSCEVDEPVRAAPPRRRLRTRTGSGSDRRPPLGMTASACSGIVPPISLGL
jgi:hypothetical protein